ncbi:MAG: sigma-70 family RNA polymerase sigma factor [Verrucomicrobiae bacterium]|nr:sigma-70 family RNA polymerase sigma factor [Verrucomicrobiae bacterium]
MPQAELSDEALLEQARQGSLEALETLVSRYEQPVYNLAMRLLRHEQDAEDVTQQTFLNLVENLDSFRGESSFRTWLYRVATFAAFKILRKRKGLDTISLDASVDPTPEQEGPPPHPEFIADWRDTPEHLAQRQEVRQLIEQALAELDEKHRVVFLLRDVEGLSVEETATALGITPANVKVRLLRARLQLRERLTRWLGDPERRLAPHQHEEAED